MAKEDIFSKINLKDYNNMLENILDKKDFTEDVKNLLLSMLYKIENGYKDYEVVKRNVKQKSNFLEEIIQIIKEKCNEIELVKPLTKQSEILEENNVNYIVDKEKGKIVTYANERIILEALIILNQKEIELKDEYKLFAIGLKEILQIGNKINVAEVIRDFNGFSWDITSSQMESKNINIIYQNLLLLLGNRFLQEWITEDKELEQNNKIELPNNEILRSKYNESFGITKEDMKEDKEIDYLKKMKEILEKRYGRENAQKFYIQFLKTIIAVGSNRNKEQKEIILEEKRRIEQNLGKMQDNKKYLEDLSNKKKEITLNIRKIDTFLSDENLLKKEYEERNSKLPNKEKIFSISHLRIMLEKERKDSLEKIKECNLRMEPKEYVKDKQILENKLKFFNDIGIEETEKIEEEKQIIKLQEIFLDCFNEKVKRAETKKDILELLYKFRYYEQIPYKQEKISKIEQLKEKIEDVEDKIIKKGCIFKLLVTFSEEENLNKKILENLFNSKIINLENTIYILKYHKGILKVQIYDAEIEEETKEIQITKKVELQVKLNKKIKILE